MNSSGALPRPERSSLFHSYPENSSAHPSVTRVQLKITFFYFRDNLTEIDGMTERLDKLLSGGKHLTSPDSLTNDFRNLLETSLWGNKCDLSISAGNKQVIACLLQIKTWPKLPTPTLFYVFPTFNHR